MYRGRGTKDLNHDVIVKALEEIGCSVVDLYRLGSGVPDLMVGYMGMTLLMEIKNPGTQYGREGLNRNQVLWKEQWKGGPYAVVIDVESALRAVRAMCNSAK